MKVFKLIFLQLMTVFKYNLYLYCTKIYRCPQVQSIVTIIRFATKKYFWNALGIIKVYLDIKYLFVMWPKLKALPYEVYFDLSNYNIPMDIHDFFKIILSILITHFYLNKLILNCFMYTDEWEDYKWLKNILLIKSYIGIFTIVLTLSCISLFRVPDTNFEKIKFVILVIVSYYTYCKACATYWFYKNKYSKCNTYTSTINHHVLKDRQCLIMSNLATRWKTKKVKKITQKEKKIVQSASKDPRLNRHGLVNKGLNNIHNQFTSLNTSQSLDDKDEYLISARIMRPDSYYDQLYTSGTCSNMLTTVDLSRTNSINFSSLGKSVLNEYPNKSRQYKLIPM